MTDWMLYAALIGVLASVVAEALHRVFLVRGLPVRWVWLVALSSTLVLPVLLPMIPQAAPEAAVDFTISTVAIGDVGPVASVSAKPAFNAGRAFLIAWIA